MVEETNQLIADFLKNELDKKIGIGWWDEKRIEQLKELLFNIGRLKENYGREELERLQIGPLETFLNKILKAYQGNDELKDWVKHLEPIGTVKDIDQRVDAIINFLKQHVMKTVHPESTDEISSLLEQIRRNPYSADYDRQSGKWGPRSILEDMMRHMDRGHLVFTMEETLEVMHDCMRDKGADMEAIVEALKGFVWILIEVAKRIDDKTLLGPAVDFLMPLLYRNELQIYDQIDRFFEYVGRPVVAKLVIEFQKAKNPYTIAHRLAEACSQKGNEALAKSAAGVMLKSFEKGVDISGDLARVAAASDDKRLMEDVTDSIIGAVKKGRRDSSLTSAIIALYPKLRDERIVKTIMPMIASQIEKGELAMDKAIEAEDLISMIGDSSLIPLIEKLLNSPDTMAVHNALVMLEMLLRSPRISQDERVRIVRLIIPKLDDKDYTILEAAAKALVIATKLRNSPEVQKELMASIARRAGRNVDIDQIIENMSAAVVPALADGLKNVDDRIKMNILEIITHIARKAKGSDRELLKPAVEPIIELLRGQNRELDVFPDQALAFICEQAEPRVKELLEDRELGERAKKILMWIDDVRKTGRMMDDWERKNYEKQSAGHERAYPKSAQDEPIPQFDFG